MESSGDGKNANLVAQLETESLAAKAAEFKTTNNDDTIGWIRIPNTNVDYPVVYKAGVENYAYYESKGYDKQYSKDGVIWADYECTFGAFAEHYPVWAQLAQHLHPKNPGKYAGKRPDVLAGDVL